MTLTSLKRPASSGLLAFTAGCLLFTAHLPSLHAEDWPRWRGVRSDGTWNGPPLPAAWSKSPFRKLWDKPVGGGYAGVTVVDNRVFVLDRQTEPDERERVLCLSADDGTDLWTHSYPVEYGDLPYGSGPRAAATVHQGRVYTLGSLGHLHCLDAATGDVLWQCHLQQDHQGRLPMWGYAASPFIVGRFIIVAPGGDDGFGIVALDRDTGERIWNNLDDEAGYATPILTDAGEKPQLIWWSPAHVHSLDPETGKHHWSVPYEVTYGVSIATPIVAEGLVFVSGYWEGSKAIRLESAAGEARLAWEDDRLLRGLMSQPLYRDGFVYLLDKRYGLTCFELETGRKVWDDENRMTPRGRNPQASLVWHGSGDHVLVLNSDGDLIVARLDPTGYHEVARQNIIGHTWAHPAYAGNRIFARSDTELVCVEFPAADESTAP